MRFHISSHHTPDMCGLGNPGKFPPNPKWPERCKELGIEYVIGGGCQPEHFHYMVVETDDPVSSDLLISRSRASALYFVP